MSKISNLIFKNAKHTITSKYGKRQVIQTSAGKTSSFHYGTDYGTYGKKLAQYAIESGTIYSCGTDTDGAKYVTIKYPRINKRFLHWHLDSIKVKKGQSVTKGTLLGYTGKTGKATGIHLHLGIIDLKTGKYVDPEVYAKQYTEPSATTIKPTVSTTSSFKKGDKIVLNGYLYRDSAGNGKGAKKTNYKGTITIVNSKGKKPYHIDGLGWVASADIKKQGTSKSTGTSSKKGTLTVNSGTWNVRKGAGMNYGIVKVVKGGTKLNHYGTSNGWYKIDGGYISPKAVKVNK